MPLSSCKGFISGTIGHFQFRSTGAFSGWRDLTIDFVLSECGQSCTLTRTAQRSFVSSFYKYGSKNFSIAKILLEQTLPRSVIYPVSGDIIVIGGCSISNEDGDNTNLLALWSCFSTRTIEN